MNGTARTTTLAAAIGLVFTVGNVTGVVVEAPASAASAAPPSAPDNFGFPFAFDVSKMDRKADPRQDFTRHAAGSWLDAAKIPSDSLRVSPLDLMAKRVEYQMRDLLDEAARTSVTAKKGTPLQQVGDFYVSGTDVKRRAEQGASPLKSEWDRIDAIKDRKSLAAAMAHLELITNDPVLVGFGVGTDPKDRTKYSMMVTDSPLPMPSLDNYLKPENAKIQEAYRKLITDDLVMAGVTPDQATARAAKILEIETRVAAKKLTPVQKQDPNKTLVSMPFAELRSLLSNLDVDTYLTVLGLPARGDVVVTEVEAVRERNAMLASLPLEDTKAYLQWELLRRTSPYLTPSFIEPQMAFTRALYGEIDTPKREKMVAEDLAAKLGHPVSQLYVAEYFPDSTKVAAENLVGRIKAEFRLRLEGNKWLSADTRKYALDKLDEVRIDVGYPDRWIDYSSVDIRRDDYLGNALRLNEFGARRDLGRLGQPVVEDGFADPRATLPIIVNAAYEPSRNGIEIPAAFLQPPFYDAKADAAVNFCSLGAVIGHELTHGFDSEGRLYDAQGNVRNWWTDADGNAFVSEAMKIVNQANAYEVVPGIKLNGQLSVGENLADIGGVAFGYGALQRYLREHPAENKEIDGMTQNQRCFVSWAQNWAGKTNEGYLKQAAATDPHPPGSYRTIAPSQHENGFYEAFGVKAGNAMWLPQADRAHIW